MRSMVTQYGMSDRFGMMALEESQSRYLDGRNMAICSESTGALADEEVQKIMEECYAKAVNLVQENEGALERIAKAYWIRKRYPGKNLWSFYRENDKQSPT